MVMWVNTVLFYIFILCSLVCHFKPASASAGSDGHKSDSHACSFLSPSYPVDHTLFVCMVAGGVVCASRYP